MSEPCCGNCRFYSFEKCRRRPPTIDLETGRGEWPRVRPGSDWCGEHQRVPLEEGEEN